MTKLLLATAAETAAGRLPQAEIAFLLLPLLLVVIFAVLYRREKRRRRQLEYLFGQTKNRCFVCDRNARILDCRPGAPAGKSASKVAGLLADAPDREEIGETIREVFRTGIPQSRHAANGEFQTFRKVPSGVFGAEAVLVLSEDESEKRELETEVRFLTAQRSAATGEMECGVLLVGCDGEILHANPAAGELTGFTARRLAGLHYAKVFPEGGAVRSLLEQALRENRPLELPPGGVLAARDGKRREIAGRVAPVPYPDGIRAGAVLILTDETARNAERRRQRFDSTALAAAFQLADLGYFSYDPVSRMTSCSEGFERLWPFQDGVPLPEKEWILPEDYDEFMRLRDRLLSGEDRIFTADYRSRYFGEMQYYRLRAHLEEENGVKVIFGVVQNVTATSTRDRRLAAGNKFVNVLFDIFPYPVYLKEASDEYRYTMCSRSWYEFFGRSPEETLGRNDRELFGEERSLPFRETDRQTNATGGPVNTMEELVDAGGRSRTFHSARVAYTTEDGRRLILGMMLDVTESRRAQLREKELQTFLEKILDLFPGGVLAKDADDDFRYVFWNKCLETHTGYAASRVIGRTDFEISPWPGNERNFRETDRRVLESETHTLHYPELLTSASGRQIHYETTKTLLENGGKRYIVELSLDNTAKHELERERERTLNRLNDFVAGEALLNSCLKRITVENDYRKAVNDILQQIGNNRKAARVYLYRFTDPEETRAECSCEWTGSGVRPRREFLATIDFSDSPELRRNLCRPEGFQVDDAALAAAESPEIAAYLGGEPLRAFSTVGIRLDRGQSGFLGVDFTEDSRQYGDAGLRPLKDMANIFLLAYQRKKQFDALADSTAVQKLIIDMMSNPVLLVDRDYRIIHANNSTAERLGVKLAECIGRRCLGTLCRRQAPDESCAVHQTLQKKAPVSMEKSIAGRDYIVNTQPIWHENEIIQVLETFTDITELNRNKKLLEQTVKDAEEAARAKSMFLATMSHELRTPLNAVIGFAEILKLGGMSRRKEEEAIQSIHFAGVTLLELINDVLDLSKLEAGQMKITPEKLDLRNLLNDLRKLFARKLDEKGLTGRIAVPADLPMLYLDLLRLRQILFNLLGNAVKFTHRGGIRLTVEFHRRDETAGDLTIRVEDTGDGIAPEYMTRIFEPFGQQDARREHIAQGTGLGLPICKRLVEQMNGTLSVTSEPEKGSCFTVFLPGVRYEAEYSGQSAAEPEPEPAAASAAGLRLLVVDDVALNCKVLAAMAAKLDFQVETAASGAEALQKLERFRPDLILTDLWMPGMNGDELAAAIRKDPCCNAARILAVTADAAIAPELRRQFDGILLKPVTLDKLRTVLSAAPGRPDIAPPGKTAGTGEMR